MTVSYENISQCLYTHYLLFQVHQDLQIWMFRNKTNSEQSNLTGKKCKV